MSSAGKFTKFWNQLLQKGPKSPRFGNLAWQQAECAQNSVPVKSRCWGDWRNWVELQFWFRQKHLKNQTGRDEREPKRSRAIAWWFYPILFGPKRLDLMLFSLFFRTWETHSYVLSAKQTILSLFTKEYRAQVTYTSLSQFFGCL